MAKEGTEEKKGQKKQATAHKRMLQNEKRRISNKAARTRIKTAVKTFHASLEAKEFDKSKTYLNDVYSLVDKATKKGLYKLNKAARVKAQLTAHLQKAQA